MRILIDANVLISYLLAPDGQAGATRIVQLLFAGHPGLDALVSETSLAEVHDAVQRKAYLSDRIPASSVTSLLDSLEHIAEIVPAVARPIAAISRDRNDDYLLVTAQFHEIDIIVSGDKDLLVLDPIGDVRMVSPAVFMTFIDVSAS